MKLQTKFFLAGGGAIAFLLALVVVQFSASDDALDQNRTLHEIATVTQRHMESDMMHDAMRGDVLAAILAVGEGDFEGVKGAGGELESHYKNFLENLTKNQESDLPNEIQEMFSGALTALQAYGDGGRDVISVASRGRDYHHALGQFNEKFEAMEEENEAISEAIAAWAEKTEKKAVSESGSARNTSIVVTILAIISALFIPVFSWISLFKPQHALTEAMQHIANNHLDTEIPGIGRKDEIGEIAATVQVFKDNAIAKSRLEAEQERAKISAEQEKRQAMEILANRFESKVQSIIQTVSSAASQLYQSSRSMTDLISGASRKAESVASASGQTSQNVQSVASAVEEMSASVREIAQQITKSAEAVRSAVHETSKADETSRLLEEATQRIGEIVDLIQNIAGQINLLALNATIESARAGEAGKGFAVVASEVKSLASQTTTATDEIASHINSIQNVSTQVVAALGSIKSAIGNVEGISSAISAAVEEQTATTNEIASNMSNAADGTNRISSDIEEVSRSSTEASSSASQTLQSAEMLTREAEKLSQEVALFLSELRQ